MKLQMFLTSKACTVTSEHCTRAPPSPCRWSQKSLVPLFDINEHPSISVSSSGVASHRFSSVSGLLVPLAGTAERRATRMVVLVGEQSYVTYAEQRS